MSGAVLKPLTSIDGLRSVGQRIHDPDNERITIASENCGNPG